MSVNTEPSTQRSWLRVLLVLIACAAILAVGGYYRLHLITEQGIREGDTVAYYKTARDWSQGRIENLMDGGFYRPTVYATNALALVVFGDNDYSIQLVNGMLDLASLMLIVIAGWQLTGRFAPGLAAAAVYALMPYAIDWCRSGMPHTISTFFVLLALCAFRPRWTPAAHPWARYGFDALAGLCLGLAANSHSELGFLGVGFFACPAAQAVSAGWTRLALLRLIGRAAALTLGFASVYLAGFAVYGPGKVLDVMSREIGAHTRTPDYFVETPLYRVPYDALAISSKAAFGAAAWIPVLALIPLAAFAVTRIARGRTEAGKFVPTMLLCGYLMLFPITVGSFDTSHARLFLPLIPLVLIGGATGLMLLGELLGARWSATPLIAGTVAMFALTPQAAGRVNYFDRADAHRKEIVRAAYDVLGERVDADHRLLILPSTAYYTGAYSLDLYFGPNAAFLVDQGRTGAYTAETLGRIAREGSLSYFLLHPRLDFRFLDPNWPSPVRGKPWFDGDLYDYETERRVIAEFFDRYHAHALATVEGAPVFSIRREPMFPNSDFSQGDLSSWGVQGAESIFRPLRDIDALPTGEFFVDTRRGDPAVLDEQEFAGELVSPGFIVSRDVIGFAVAGTVDPAAMHIALRVGGTELRASAAGAALQSGEWDVEQFRGQEARVFVRDLDPRKRQGIAVTGFYYVH